MGPIMINASIDEEDPTDDIIKLLNKLSMSISYNETSIKQRKHIGQVCNTFSLELPPSSPIVHFIPVTHTRPTRLHSPPPTLIWTPTRNYPQTSSDDSISSMNSEFLGNNGAVFPCTHTTNLASYKNTLKHCSEREYSNILKI